MLSDPFWDTILLGNQSDMYHRMSANVAVFKTQKREFPLHSNSRVIKYDTPLLCPYMSDVAVLAAARAQAAKSALMLLLHHRI